MVRDHLFPPFRSVKSIYMPADTHASPPPQAPHPRRYSFRPLGYLRLLLPCRLPFVRLVPPPLPTPPPHLPYRSRSARSLYFLRPSPPSYRRSRRPQRLENLGLLLGELPRRHTIVLLLALPAHNHTSHQSDLVNAVRPSAHSTLLHMERSDVFCRSVHLGRVAASRYFRHLGLYGLHHWSCHVDRRGERSGTIHWLFCHRNWAFRCRWACAGLVAVEPAEIWEEVDGGGDAVDGGEQCRNRGAVCMLLSFSPYPFLLSSFLFNHRPSY